jgi:hypothetical protein
MTRVLVVFAVAASAVLCSPVPSAIAAPDEGGQCTFVMSAPQAVALPGPGGAKGVTATITWKSCTGLASPAYSEVCVSSPTSNGHCSKRIGWDAPQAIFPTPNPAGPFTAQARGCYRTPSEASLVCDTATQSATLSAGGALPNLPIGGAAPY